MPNHSITSSGAFMNTDEAVAMLGVHPEDIAAARPFRTHYGLSNRCHGDSTSNDLD